MRERRRSRDGGVLRSREKRRWLRDVAKASGIERPPPKPAPVVHGLLLKQGQHGLWNRRAAKLRGDPWRFEWCDPESQGRPGGRIDLTEATIVIDEDAFAVDGVRFKGLNAVDAARWLACIRAARSGASRKAVLELWSPTAEPPKSSPSVVLAVALVAFELRSHEVMLAFFEHARAAFDSVERCDAEWNDASESDRGNDKVFVYKLQGPRALS